MRFKQLPPLFLAALLQLAPMCRTFLTVNALPGFGYAIVSPWVAAAAALFGYHAIAGASVTITSPKTANATNGVTFKYTITTSTYYSDMRYTGNGTPTGVSGISASVSPIITGTPTAAGVYTMAITVSASGYTSVNQNVTVTVINNGPPTITTQPQNLSLVQGSSGTFSVTAPGATNYQWYFNGSPIALATNYSYAIANAQTANAGNYYVTALNQYGSTNSVTVTLAVHIPPSIATQPTSQVANQGSNVTFNVVASGDAPLIYQWYYGTNLLPNVTNAACQIPNAQGTNAGSYFALVTNLYGSATSSVATLTIAGDISLNNGPPSLIAPIYAPETTNAYTAKLGNTSTGTPTGTQVYTGAKLSGTNYTVQLWGALGTNLPESALAAIPNALAALKTGGLIAIPSPNPVIPGAVEGQVATLELRVWDNQLGTITNWSQVLAQTNINRGVSAIFNSQPLGGVSAAPNLIGITSFNLHLPLAPFITNQPQNVTIASGATALFSVGAGGDSPLFYQWELNGTPILGATNTAYALTNASSGASGGSYSVLVSNASGTVQSSSATLTVTSSTPTPVPLSPSLFSNQFVISFPTVAAQKYSVQYTTGLSPTAWLTLTNITAASTNLNVYDPITAPQRYYRVTTTN